MKWYLWHLESIEELIDEFKEYVIDQEFTSKTKNSQPKPVFFTYCWNPRYQEFWAVIHDVVNICDMFGIRYLEENKALMLERVNMLNSPECIQMQKVLKFTSTR